MQNKTIYLDNASTTRIHPQALQAMTDAMNRYYANASSVHTMGMECKNLLEDARNYFISTLSPSLKGMVYFTSGGTESDNWALKGICEASSGKHIITSKIEHNAILKTCSYLERHGYDISYINVDETGIVDLQELENAIRPDTILISIMFANNEVGTLQPIKEIGEIAKKHGILFHTDAVGSYAQVPIDVDALNMDLLSVSSHKFHGPKGVGFLYVRNGVYLEPLIHGGSQESGLRAGTANLPGIIGMQEAAKIAFSSLKTNQNQLIDLRQYFIDRILREIPCAKINGSPQNRLPNNISISFSGFSAGKLLDLLDQDGIIVSTGSACASGSGKPSHVLTALGLSEEEIDGSLRFSLNTSITKSDLDYTVRSLQKHTIAEPVSYPINIFSINV